MLRISATSAAKAAAVLAFSLCAALLSPAQNLQTIDPPGGGKIVYGQVAGVNTEAAAMGSVLHKLHDSLGEKPQVGKLFQVRGTNSYATFFNITRHDQGPGKPALKVSGLLIAVKVADGHVEAALVSDDAARFSKTLNPMMQTLMKSWHPFQGVQSQGGHGHPGASGSIAPLHQVVLQDRSASASLPDGWQLSPNQSAMGTMVATGPNGEAVSLGVAFSATDSNNPRAQQTMRIVQNGGMSHTVYANAFYYPWGGNLAKAFVDFIEHLRQKAGLQPIQFNLSNPEPVQSGPRQHCAHMEGTTDFQDGKGKREINLVFCEGTPGPASGAYVAVAYSYSLPIALADREDPTMGAILQSFNINQQVINQEIGQIAGPAIAQIHAIGHMVTERINATHAAEDEHNRSIEKYWDNNDKRSQEFENYQLGYAVVADTGNNAHGTLWADDAALLVQSNPDKFEYVSAPNYWKGIDY